MMNQDLAKELNAQFNLELTSAYLYLGMSARLEELNYSGMSHWMRQQAAEEMTHAEAFCKHLQDRSQKICFGDLKAPSIDDNDPMTIFEAAYRHEQKVTASLQAIAEKAVAANDFVAGDLLREYLKEQVEEEKTLLDILARFRHAAGSRGGLLYIDHELGKR